MPRDCALLAFIFNAMDGQCWTWSSEWEPGICTLERNGRPQWN